MYKKLSLFMVVLFLFVTFFSFNVMAHSDNTDSNGGHYVLEENSVLGYHYHSGEYAGWFVKIDPGRIKTNVKKCLEAAGQDLHIPLTDLKALDFMPGDYVYKTDSWGYDYKLITSENSKIKIKNQLEIYQQITKPDKTVKIPEAGKYFYRNSEEKGQEIPVEYAFSLGFLPDKEQFGEYWAICKMQDETFKEDFSYEGKVRINISGAFFHNINNETCDTKSDKKVNLVLAYARGYTNCKDCFISTNTSPSGTITATASPTNTATATATNTATLQPTSTITPTNTAIVTTAAATITPGSSGDLPETGEGSSGIFIIIGIALVLTGLTVFFFKDKILKE